MPGISFIPKERECKPEVPLKAGPEEDFEKADVTKMLTLRTMPWVT